MVQRPEAEEQVSILLSPNFLLGAREEPLMDSLSEQYDINDAVPCGQIPCPSQRPKTKKNNMMCHLMVPQVAEEGAQVEVKCVVTPPRCSENSVEK